MRKLLIILSLVISACSHGQMMLGQIKTGNQTGITWNGKTFVVLGDSEAFGYGVSSGEEWPAVFATGKSATADNNAINGTGIDSLGTCASFRTMPLSDFVTYNSGTHSALIIAAGTNDVGWNNGTFTVTHFKERLTILVQYANLNKGWPLNRIIVMNTYRVNSYTAYVGLCSVASPANQTRIDSYNTAVAEVATEQGVIFYNLYGSMSAFTSGDFQADGLHLNATGQSKLANILITDL